MPRGCCARLRSAALFAGSRIGADRSAAAATTPGDRAAELDPNAPLAPLPDLGVEWPRAQREGHGGSASRRLRPSRRRRRRRSRRPRRAARFATRSTSRAWRLVGNAEDLLKAFRQQSALEAERKDPANAAQIGRRASADADLLTQLLRSQGYYDADVEARTERSGDALRVDAHAPIPAQQYRFASVELPGLEAAGADAAKLRDAFAVKAGDPVIAQT